MSCSPSSDRINDADPVTSRHLIVLLAADAAAVGVWQDGSMVRHRCLTGYTVRKQQGKAQASYQRQGGGQGSKLMATPRSSACQQRIFLIHPGQNCVNAVPSCASATKKEPAT